MEKLWKIKNKVKYSQELEKEYHPVVLELLAKRGLIKKEEIEKYFSFDYEKDLNDPLEIVGMKKAVERIILAKEKKERIAIFGDYDADGVSSSALIFETLTNLGFADILCYIPDRQLEGYGMNEMAIEYLAKQNIKLIVTVDCGITNYREVEAAKVFGMDVIITDHHSVAVEIPLACACINPNIPKSGFVFKELAGVGVAFKLAQALYIKIDPQKIEQLKWSLDLVALGTIADCVALTGENRILAKYGLIVFSKTKRVGFLEMFKVGRIDVSENNIPNARKVAFQIAPRINAAGRMDHANCAYNLLIEKDIPKARSLALELESKNQQRQKITTEIFREVQILAQNSFREKKFIFAENEHWPVGVLGLVAGKITEEFQKPTAVFQKKENELVGSFRSIPGINIIEMLKKCTDLLIKFGGHAQAAGASIAPENIEKFYAKMGELIAQNSTSSEISSALEIDCEITDKDINWELLTQIKKMEPFGQGNEEPIFCVRNLIVADLKIVGNGQKHLKLTLRGEKGSPKIFEAIGFSLAEKFSQIKKDDKIDIVFNLEEDEWNGNKKMQLKLIDLKMAL